MTQEEFIKKIREQYLKSRELAIEPEIFRDAISRGTSRSISSLAEDLFGCYCAEKIKKPDGLKIYVDPQLSFSATGFKNKSGKRPLLIRPDLLIARKDNANCMFDLKTDLGYRRVDFFNQAVERNTQIDLIKGKQANCNNGISKLPQTISFSKSLKFVYIILSQKNAITIKLDKMMKKVRELENLEVFLLTTGKHLNSYDPSPNWKINKTDFDTLDEIIENSLN